jgi:hypothetical protein
MKTSRLTQYRELQKFLQAKVRENGISCSFGEFTGYETARKFFLAAE